MELLLILFILVLGGVVMTQLRNDDWSRVSEGTERNAGGAERGADDDFSFNPATGLPMWGSELDSLDLEGNMWGFGDETLPMHRHPADQRLSHRLNEPFDEEPRHFMTNPATGLPMAFGGAGGLDVAGNPYGTNLDDVFSRGGAFESGVGAGFHDPGGIHDSFGSGSSSLGSFDSGSSSSGAGFGSDW